MAYQQALKSALFEGVALQEKITFGGGCFWCTEAIFDRLDGVFSVRPGYMGGEKNSPTYEEVSRGDSGYVEVVQVTYDPNRIPSETLLEIFWKTHDPTTLNRQGDDVGTQYQSVIFYHSEQQRQTAESWKQKLNEEKIWDKPIVTEIVPAKRFYAAEEYHQKYFDRNPKAPYCELVIVPKLEKLEKLFADRLK